MSLLSAIYFISGTVSSNPVAVSYSPAEFCCIPILFLFLINFPINSIIYIGLVYLIVFMKNKKRILKENPGTFIQRVLIVTCLATIFGGIVDIVVMIDITTFFLIGLTLIFFSYFFLIIYVQKLTKVEALKIASGVVLTNCIVWVTIISSKSIRYFILLIGLAGLIGFVVILYFVWHWYNKNYILMRNVKTTNNVYNIRRGEERLLACILKAQTIFKEFSIFFTNHQIIITKRGLSANLEEVQNSDKIIKRIPYDRLVHINFKTEFLNNDLVIKTKTSTNEYYCNREEMIIAKYILNKDLEGVILS